MALKPDENICTPTKRSFTASELEVSDKYDVTIHGQVVELSPVKKSKNRENCTYFNGKITDGLQDIKFVSFEPKLRPSIEKFKSENVAVALSGCRVQTNKYDSTLEILTSKFSTIEKSPQKFKIKEVESKCDMITIGEVLTSNVNQHVNVTAKVVKVNQPNEVITKTGKKLTKQDCVIKDTSGYSCRVVLWQEDVGCLELGKCNKFMNVLIRSYEGLHYLSLCDGSSVDTVSDIDDIDDMEECQDETAQTTPIMTAVGEILSVLSVSDYSSCLVCSGLLHPINDVLAKCSKCSATTKIANSNSCKFAKILLSKDSKNWFLTVYNEQLVEIVSDVNGASLEEKLLNTGEISVQYYTATNIIKSVQK